MPLPNAAAGTKRRMQEMDEMTGAPPPVPASPAPPVGGAVKRTTTPLAGEVESPPARGLGSAIKRMMGFGAKKAQ